MTNFAQNYIRYAILIFTSVGVGLSHGRVIICFSS